MTTYNSNKCVAGVQPKYLPTAGSVNVVAMYTQNPALALNDIVNMINLAADASDPNGQGPSIVGIALDTDQLDSGGAAAITLDVGDATSAQRYFAASTVGQAGGLVSPTKGGILGYQPFGGSYFATYTTVSLATYTILLKCHAAAQTAITTAQIRLATEYTYDP